MNPLLHTTSFQAKCWIYNGEKAAWHFVSLPPEEALLISELSKLLNAKQRRGWGSIPVSVQIGKTKWDTSIFPDSKRATYLLPIKADVRKAEGVSKDSLVSVTLSMSIE